MTEGKGTRVYSFYLLKDDVVCSEMFFTGV